jgi:glutamate synthase (NADPH/NADH) large chain
VALIAARHLRHIYSIEDLAFFDLRQVAPQADVSVKLVSEAGGDGRAGVASAGGCHPHRGDGGTGASRSRRSERGRTVGARPRRAQRELIDNRLRGRVRLRVDGRIRTGRDVLLPHCSARTR